MPLKPKRSKLILEDGTIFTGHAFGWNTSVSGEVVFNTGMVGYPESLTDPSYQGQILVLTYPLVGNYGVPAKSGDDGLEHRFESERIRISGLVVSELSVQHSHWDSTLSLDEWLKAERVPAVFGVDTRAITKRLRESGTLLGKLLNSGGDIGLYDPNKENLVAQVSVTEPRLYGDGRKRVLVIDCGCKHNIINSLITRGVAVMRVSWDYDFLDEEFDGVLISNGPGDPKMARATINNVRRAMSGRKPIFGICLGNQILALAAGANTYKLKFGHRSQNQPCLEVGKKTCYITSQNHGYAVDTRTLPDGWRAWFLNANDGTNEGIRHRSRPFMSVQFHPEAAPGPVDTGFLFDQFVEML